MSIHSWRCYTLVVFAVLYPFVAWADPGSCVEVTGSQCVVVDGKRFFPVGIYSAGVDDFPELADAGFNLVHTYGWEGISGNDWGKAWLDAAEKHGLMALVGLYRPRVRSGKFVDCLPRVEQYRSHPALLAWHTMDEPGWEKEKDRGDQYMPAAYRFLRKHDPNHPVTAVVCHFADTTRFADTVDVLQADYYPIPPIPASDFCGTGFRGIKMYVDRWRKDSNAKKPLWFVCQAFDYSLLKEDNREITPEWKRFPTKRELRTMTYTAIASGAKGILYWSLNRLRNVREGSDVSAEDHWNRLTGVTRELNRLMPLLTADTPETIQSKDHVVAMTKSDGVDTYMIIANYERRPTETVLEVPGVANATACGVFGEKSAKIENGKLALSLEPIESRVYRILSSK